MSKSTNANYTFRKYKSHHLPLSPVASSGPKKKNEVNKEPEESDVMKSNLLKEAHNELLQKIEVLKKKRET